MGTIVIDFDSNNPEATYILTRARELIEDPVNWIQGPHAVDEDHEPVDAESLNACAWCAWGAMESISDQTGVSLWPAYDVLTKEAVRAGFPEIWHLNDDDETEHSDVLAAFDAAIESTLVHDDASD